VSLFCRQIQFTEIKSSEASYCCDLHIKKDEMFPAIRHIFISINIFQINGVASK